MPSFFDLVAQSSSTAYQLEMVLPPSLTNKELDDDRQGRFEADVILSRHGRHDQRSLDHFEPFNFIEAVDFGSLSEILLDLESIPDSVLDVLDNIDDEEESEDDEGEMDEDDEEESDDDDDGLEEDEEEESDEDEEEMDEDDEEESDDDEEEMDEDDEEESGDDDDELEEDEGEVSDDDEEEMDEDDEEESGEDDEELEEDDGEESHDDDDEELEEDDGEESDDDDDELEEDEEEESGDDDELEEGADCENDADVDQGSDDCVELIDDAEVGEIVQVDGGLTLAYIEQLFESHFEINGDVSQVTNNFIDLSVDQNTVINDHSNVSLSIGIVDESDNSINDSFNETIDNSVNGFELSLSDVSLSNLIAGERGRGREKVRGTSADDVIGAGPGRDRLVGRRGADSFVFDNSNHCGRRQADVIQDFRPDQGDRILLDSDAFSGEGSVGIAESRREFRQMRSDSDHEFLYFQPKGGLYYNENGDDSGWGDGGLIAALKGAPELDANQISLI
jgi:uncharacterized protein YkvS